MKVNCTIHGNQDSVLVISDQENVPLARVLGTLTPSGERVNCCVACINSVDKVTKKPVKLALTK